jgi:Tfp pilus assembly PilM family ATPase
MPGVAKALAEMLGIPALVVAPLQHIRNRFSTSAVDTQAAEHAASAVSVGLAMGAAA